MDTLFRLVSLQSDQSYNSSRTSSSSRSSRQNHHHHHQEDEECLTFSWMKRLLFFFFQALLSLSATNPSFHHHHPTTTNTSTPTHHAFEPTEFSFLPCPARVQQLMWMLNELSSPYGDTDQKLAAYFLQALFSRMTDSEVSPWTTFGHVACNGAIMELLKREPSSI
ncbi:Protein short-root [Vitis vinifera]|uniref:Protein short-root n=1 Tax=Vitis vinifera TaxID=29760 RepID=A0A438FBJ7_VITVI|nr:Protein short-root [Vitis vinifera]